MAKPKTSIDVARRAGVSQSTVSRVFSENSPNVSDEARQRVLNAARDLNYQPSAIARAMSSQQTNIVGIVMANITSPFYPYVLEKFLQRLQETDRQALLFTASAGQNVDDLLPLVLQHRVDALIVTSALLSSEMADQCVQAGTPVILFNRYIRNAPVSAVCADNVDGGRKIANLLLSTGHQRLAYIAESANTSTSIDREQGFTEVLRVRNYDGWQRMQGEYTYESGYAAALELLTNDQPPDAIFCANDIMALGAMDCARKLGISIPDAVSVVGFDDIPMAAWGAYNLTTVSQEVDTMIDRAIALMEAKIADPYSPAILEFVPGQLKIRGSVRGFPPQFPAE
jgi:DNA-binding LacI/PurR family transcriptional regulator